MSKIIFQKTYNGNAVESFDAFDIINNDEIITDVFGDAHGTFTVTVTYEAPDYDPDEEA